MIVLKFITFLNATERSVTYLSEGWMFLVFLAMFGLLSIVRWNYNKNLKELFKAVVNVRMLREILREEIVLASRASQLLTVLACLSYSLFFYLFFKHLGFSFQSLKIDGFLHFLFILSIVVALYFIKILVLNLVKFLFEGDYSLTEYEFNFILLIKVVGLSLIPVSLLLAYYSEGSRMWLLNAGIVVMTLGLVWRWVRGFSNALLSGVSLVYIILYLCTLEILPVAVLLKAVS